jgi:hypothetical protein
MGSSLEDRVNEWLHVFDVFEHLEAGNHRHAFRKLTSIVWPSPVDNHDLG